MVKLLLKHFFFDSTYELNILITKQEGLHRNISRTLLRACACLVVLVRIFVHMHVLTLFCN